MSNESIDLESASTYDQTCRNMLVQRLSLDDSRTGLLEVGSKEEMEQVGGEAVITWKTAGHMLELAIFRPD